jgi:putative oxidoreductase
MSALLNRLAAGTAQFRATRETHLARDLALLAARVGLGWIFVYHGAATLFGAFGGAGLHSQEVYFATVAHLHPASFFAVLGGIIECFGGAAVALGVFGRLAAAGLVGDMVIAMITVTFRNGIVSDAAGSGYELNVALAALALVVAILGTGRFSLDEALRPFVVKLVPSDAPPPPRPVDAPAGRVSRSSGRVSRSSGRVSRSSGRVSRSSGR